MESSNASAIPIASAKGGREPSRVVAEAALRDHPALGRLALDAGVEAPGTAFLLAQGDGALELRPPGEHARPGIRARFPPDRGAVAAARQPLRRAFGQRIHTIVDVTAGLGADAYRLAAAGYRVLACERDPVVHALLTSAWQAASASGVVPSAVAERLRFLHEDGIGRLASLTGPDLGVFVDPMYPAPRRASAKPRRALQVLRALLPEDRDAGALVDAARQVAARVVVKRPHHAEPLRPDPDFSLASKLVRFDVYVEPTRMTSRSG